MQALAAVVAGNADVYVGPPSTAMRVIVKGQKLKVFGVLMNQVPAEIVIQGKIARERHISAKMPLEERIKAIKGLTIGVNATGTAPDRVLRYALGKYGIDPDSDLTILPVGSGPAMLAAFEQKRIDGFIWGPPTPDIAAEKFGGEIVWRFSSGEFKPLRGFVYLSLISREDWLDANPERSTKVVKAIWRAMKLLHDHPKQAQAAVGTLFPNMDKSIFNAGFAALAPSIPTSPKVSPGDIVLAEQFEDETAHVKFNLDPASVFTNEFVEAAGKSN